MQRGGFEGYKRCVRRLIHNSTPSTNFGAHSYISVLYTTFIYIMVAYAFVLRAKSMIET
jgi:hypothetical protein